MVRVVLDEFKSHLEVRGTAGAPPSHPHPRVPRFPDTAGGFLQVPPPPSPRDRAAPVERCDTCQSSRRHGIATDGSREKQREPSRSNGGRQMARRLRLVPWKLSKSEQDHGAAFVPPVFFALNKQTKKSLSLEPKQQDLG